MVECTCVIDWTAFILEVGEGVVFCMFCDEKRVMDLSWMQLRAVWLEPELISRFVSSLPLKETEPKTQIR